MKNKIKPCPFCGSDDIKYSNKHAGYYKYHVAMFCNSCHCYGARQKIKGDQLEEGKKIAISNWNNRGDYYV